MVVYSVMLEGDESGKHFLVTLDVLGFSQAQAETLAMAEAERRNLSIVAIEEVNVKGSSDVSAGPGVLKVYGKAYFDAQE